MSVVGWLGIYSAAIVAVSLLGGILPIIGRVTHGRLQVYLSLSAGVMLGAAFFHVMPDAMELSGRGFGWWMALSVVGLFCIERFIAPHSHEVSAESGDHEAPGLECGHPHTAAPPVTGWMPVFGLTIHTFMNGVGLAGAVRIDHGATALMPGLAMFLAVVLHKPADALAISTVLGRKGVSMWRLSFVQLGFAAMIPAGALAFYFTQGAITESMANVITGAALSFSAGTFLLVALSDLLPEVQFHRHDRVVLSLALILGIALMGGISLLEGQSQSGHSFRQSMNGTSSFNAGKALRQNGPEKPAF